MSPTSVVHKAALPLSAGVICAVLLTTSADAAPTAASALHVDQSTLPSKPFVSVFESGEKLFRVDFESADGVGANLSADAGVSIRFSRVPRADLPGFQADPIRNTGPDAQSCTACHNEPFEAGAGGLAANGVRDTHRTGNPADFVIRNTLHLFGSGALQRLAEEATEELKAIRANAVSQARSSGKPVTLPLTTSNNVNYGTITATPTGDVDLHAVHGVDLDLIVKPYFWKGELASFLRALVRGSAALELGMQGIELVGPNNDLDGDGVANELTVGDVTAMTLYIAAQPRPVSELELARHLGGKFSLKAADIRAIENGERLFGSIGCADCHKPAMVLKSSQFQEPSADADYRDQSLLMGVDPRAVGLDAAKPVRFDLAANPTVSGCSTRHDRDESAQTRAVCFPQFERYGSSGVVVRLYGDLKRHDMGPALADPIDELGTGVRIWKTRELWGVGSTGPWLHDGRATTLSEAILLHGGEGHASRDAFAALSSSEKEDVVRFLKNLILFKPKSARESAE